MKNDKDNFTFWFLVGVMTLIVAVLGGVFYALSNRELTYERQEVVQPKSDPVVESPIWECPEGTDCKG